MGQRYASLACKFLGPGQNLTLFRMPVSTEIQSSRIAEHLRLRLLLSIFPTAILPSDNLIDTAMNGQGTSRMMKRYQALRRVDTLIGALLCALAAVGASAVSVGHPWEIRVPLFFSLVLFAVSVIFGTRAGILGTMLAAAIFAIFLFRPTGSFSIASDAARNNIGWMLLIGIFFSFLFAPPASGFRRH